MLQKREGLLGPGLERFEEASVLTGKETPFSFQPLQAPKNWALNSLH